MTAFQPGEVVKMTDLRRGTIERVLVVRADEANGKVLVELESNPAIKFKVGAGFLTRISGASA